MKALSTFYATQFTCTRAERICPGQLGEPTVGTHCTCKPACHTKACQLERLRWGLGRWDAVYLGFLFKWDGPEVSRVYIPIHNGVYKQHSHVSRSPDSAQRVSHLLSPHCTLKGPSKPSSMTDPMLNFIRTLRALHTSWLMSISICQDGDHCNIISWTNRISRPKPPGSTHAEHNLHPHNGYAYYCMNRLDTVSRQYSQFRAMLMRSSCSSSLCSYGSRRKYSLLADYWNTMSVRTYINDLLVWWAHRFARL